MGESAREKELLDVVAEEEKKVDIIVQDAVEARIVNTEFELEAAPIVVNSKSQDWDENDLKKLVAEETQHLVEQILSLRKSVEDKQNENYAAQNRLKSARKGVTTDDDEADTTQADTLVMVMGVLLVVMIGIVLCLGCMIRNGRRRRAQEIAF